MKINWFKIEKEDLLLLISLTINLIYEHFYTHNFIVYLTQGKICKDCGKKFVSCFCKDLNFPIIEKEQAKYKFIDFIEENFNKKLIRELMSKLKILRSISHREGQNIIDLVLEDLKQLL